jgi:flagellar basal-body rod protein FlgB
MELFDNSTKAMGLALGAAGLREQLLSNNIANVNTPGYKRQDVSFDGVLQQALQSADDGNDSALDNATPQAYTDTTSTMRADGNNVDIDNEMSQLAQNNVRYNALVQLAGKQMSMLSYAISGGGHN